jgi:hypothetical protein
MKQPGADEKAVLAASPYAAFFTPPQAPAGAPDSPKPGPQAAAAPAAPAMPDPTLWWNMLQDQFTKAVTNAMAPETVANMSTMAKEAADRMREAAAGSSAASGAPAKPDQPAAPGGGSPTPRAPKAKAGKA